MYVKATTFARTHPPQVTLRQVSQGVRVVFLDDTRGMVVDTSAFNPPSYLIGVVMDESYEVLNLPGTTRVYLERDYLKRHSPRPYPVGDVLAGQPIIFEKQFSRTYKPTEVFMVCNIPDTYRPDHKPSYKVTCVVHIASGLISFVDNSRLVRMQSGTAYIQELTK